MNTGFPSLKPQVETGLSGPVSPRIAVDAGPGRMLWLTRQGETFLDAV